MSIPIAVVFVVVGLPVYAFGHMTRTANAFTAASLGYVLGFLSSFLWGFTLNSSSDDRLFAVATMGWSGALAGLVFWYVAQGQNRRE